MFYCSHAPPGHHRCGGRGVAEHSQTCTGCVREHVPMRTFRKMMQPPVVLRREGSDAQLASA
eukprot:10226431-Heterocapsa_arctica.AAC.1